MTERMKSIRTLLPILLVAAFAVVACTGVRPRYERVLQRAHEQNQAYDSITNIDSLRLAAEYFDRHGSANERMRAHYLLGCAYRDMGDAPRALEAYYDAADRADTTSNDCDYGQLMRVHAQMANIFMMQYLPVQALRQFDCAGHFSLIAGDTLSYLHILSNKSNCYYELGDNKRLSQNGEKLFSLYCMFGDSTSAAYSITPNLNLAIESGEWGKVQDLLHFIEKFKDTKRTEANAMFNYYWARFYIHKEKYDSTLLCLRRMLAMNSNLNHQIIAYQTYSQLYRRLGEIDSALFYSDRYCAVNDSSMKNVAIIKLGRMQALYDYHDYQHQAALQALRVKQSQLISYILVLVLFSVIFLSYLGYIHFRKRKEAELKEQNNRYNELLTMHNEAVKNLNSLKSENSSINSLIIKKESELNELKLLLAEYNDKKDLDGEMESELFMTEIVSRFHKLAAIGGKPTDYNWLQLRKTVNQYLPTFISKLSNQYADLNNKETNLCILVKLHFIPTEIAILLSMTKQSVSNSRSRLMRKMFKSEGGARLFDDKISEL